MFVSHSAKSVLEMCTRACVLSEGRKVFDGSVEQGLALYQDLCMPASPVTAS